ncbi:hypothetical protein Tco_0622863 [Tanacetum coccineum]
MMAKQLTAKRNYERVKSILLLAIHDEYLLKFHNVPDLRSSLGCQSNQRAIQKAFYKIMQVADRGLSSHMTGNLKAYLSDAIKLTNGGLCGFGQLRATYGAELVSAASLVNTARPTLSTARLSLCCSKVLHDGNDVWIGRDLERRESVSKQGRKKSKPESTLDDSTVFDDQDADHGMEYMETEEAVDEGRQSGETEEVKLTDDTEVVEDKGSGDKGGKC